MARDERTDEQLLLSRAPGQAGRAFETFYLRHERLVLAFHQRRVRDPERAADLTAETFAAALDARSRFRSRGDGSGAAWLYGIAGNVYARSVRRAAVERRKCERLALDRPVLDDDRLEEIERAATVPAVVAALAGLPQDQHAAISAYVLHDEDYDAIGARLGVPPATVRKRVSRGLAALRGRLEEGR
ncbi:MAG: sigma-70 family RNA polymerase sigma factor [Patulibacter minatonensis]